MTHAEVKKNIDLRPFTYYKIGGPAAYFIDVQNLDDIKAALAFADTHTLPFFILGAGSNILISEKGFSGIVLHVKNKTFEILEGRIQAGAGLQMAELVAKAVREGFSGVEWAIGIPGTVGGSVRGNAGCFGGEIKDIARRVQFFDTTTRETRWIDRRECLFGYRTSIFKSHPEWIVFSLELVLPRGSTKESQALIVGHATKRSHSQAIGEKSAGCIFKNISWQRLGARKETLIKRHPDLGVFMDLPGIPAAYCIEAAGLKGFAIGGVQISPKHANYFINNGDATADEVIMLIAVAKDRVRRKFGVVLEEEIQYVGF